MKNIIKIALLSTISLSAMADIETMNAVSNYFDKVGIECQHVVHIEEKVYGNIKAFDITCVNNNNIGIFQYVPEQLVRTHYLEK